MALEYRGVEGSVSFEFPQVAYCEAGPTSEQLRKQVKAAEKRERRARRAQKAAKAKADARRHEIAVARAALLDVAQNQYTAPMARVDAAVALLDRPAS